MDTTDFFAAAPALRFGALTLPGRLFLAPMAGVTDLAFRTVCAELGADVTVTEMVSSRALRYQDKKSVSLLKKTPTGVCGAQLFGNEPAVMAQAARLALQHSGCDYLDLNMGCPMPKIAGNGDGCGLMRTPQLASDIVKAVKDAVPVPVTVKCRKGWDKGACNAPEFAYRMQQAGADAICIHGRTRAQLYSGVADWDCIHAVKQAVSIPVIANGDIFDASCAVRCLKRTGADALMVGRAAFGDPWIFSEISAVLAGKVPPPRPPLQARLALALRQIELAAEDKGEHIACLEARKHFAWYLRGVPYANYYKEQISSVTTLQQVRAVAQGAARDLRDPEAPKAER